MEQYLNTLSLLHSDAPLYGDRTGVGRHRLFGGYDNVGMETYDLSKGLPLVTTRSMFVTGLIRELFAFIRGSTHVQDLGENFWGKWAVREEDVRLFAQQRLDEIKNSGQYPDGVTDEEEKMFLDHVFNQHKPSVGTIGPMYGKLWRSFPRTSFQLPWWLESYADVPSDIRTRYKEDFIKEVTLSNGTVANDKETWEKYCFNRYNSEGYDQLAMVMKSLKVRPYSSRHRVTAFHPDLCGSESVSPQENVIKGYGALTPCHSHFQFMVTDSDAGEKVLNCMMYMSSSDVPIGRPYNIAQYSILTMLVAHCLGYKPGMFTIVSCDTHLYSNQRDLVPQQLERSPLPLPQLVINPEQRDLFAMMPSDLKIEGYDFHPAINYPVAK